MVHYSISQGKSDQFWWTFHVLFKFLIQNHVYFIHDFSWVRRNMEKNKRTGQKSSDLEPSGRRASDDFFTCFFRKLLHFYITTHSRFHFLNFLSTNQKIQLKPVAHPLLLGNLKISEFSIPEKRHKNMIFHVLDARNQREIDKLCF